MGYAYGFGYGHTWRNAKRRVTSVAVGGGALLVGEANGFATDFTYATDAQRVALKASSALTYYPVDSFYTQSGTSPKMVYDVAGVLGWSPHNMVLQSQTIDDATWGKSAGTVGANAIAAPDGTTTADAFIPNAGSVSPYVTQPVSAGLTASTPYTFSAYMKNGTLGTPWINIALISPTTWRAWFNLSTGVKGTSLNSPTSWNITSVGGGWYRIDVTVIVGTTSMTAYISTCATDGGLDTITGNGTSPSYYVWGAQINKGSTPLPYLPTTTAARVGLALDYDPVTHAAKGLLCEPQATNNQTRSSDFTTGWGPNEATVSANVVTAPNGLAEADAIIPANTVGGRPFVNWTSTTTAATVTTYSLFAKIGTLGSKWLEVQIGGTPTVTAWFNLTTGVKGTATGSPISYTITAVGNGWYRLIVTFTAGAASAATYLCVDDADGGASGSGDGVKPAFYLWGTQMEAGTVATSPIPTLAATVTRAADQVSVTPASIGYSATAGSWWADVNILPGSSDRRIIGYDSIVTPMYVQTSTQFSLYDAGFLAIVVPNSAGAHKCASAFQAGSRGFTVDGLAAVSDAGGTTTLLAPTTITFGSGAGNSINGYIRQVRYLPRRPTNTELQTMTMTAPIYTVLPVITGSPAIGAILTASTGTWTATPTPTYAYQWNKAGAVIAGATTSTYTVQAGDAGAMITVTVTATNAAGSAVATSAAVGPVLSVVGGDALLVGEANGFATDFLYATDAQRVALKTSGSTLSYAVDAFYQNAGTSPKMVYDVNGVLGWSPHNLLTQSQTFDDAAWTKSGVTVTANDASAPDGTMTADKIVFATGTALEQIYQLPTAADATYTRSVYIKGTAGEKVSLSDAVGGNLLHTLTGGWDRVQITSTGTAIYFSVRVGTAGLPETARTVWLWGAQVNRGTVPLAYLPTTTAARVGLALDYDPVSHAARGLLCEPQATNLLLRSSDYANATWQVFGATKIGIAAVTDPFGGSNAYEVNMGSTGGADADSAGAVYQGSVSVTGGSAYTASFYLRAKTGTTTVRIGANIVAPLAAGYTADLTVTTAWQRFSITNTANGTSSAIVVSIRNNVAGNTGNIYVSHAQFETGTVATSPIPTTSATVTRAADQVNVAAASINYSATAGSWWADVNLLSGNNDNRLIGQSGTSSPIFYNNSAFEILSAGGPLLYILTTTLGVSSKVASAFQNGDRAITANGLAPSTDTATATNLLNPNAIYFGNDLGSGVPTHGYIRKVRYVPRRKTNPELVTETT